MSHQLDGICDIIIVVVVVCFAVPYGIELTYMYDSISTFGKLSKTWELGP
eukprot:06711.XXX_26508_26657_1 [CDS] Oithona nana genome sequencing.